MKLKSTIFFLGALLLSAPTMADSIEGAQGSSYKDRKLRQEIGRYRIPVMGFDSFAIQGVGLRVQRVAWRSEAARIGLEPGDIVVALNGKVVDSRFAWEEAVLDILYQYDDRGAQYKLRPRGSQSALLLIQDRRTGRLVTDYTYMRNWRQ